MFFVVFVLLLPEIGNSSFKTDTMPLEGSAQGAGQKSLGETSLEERSEREALLWSFIPTLGSCVISPAIWAIVGGTDNYRPAPFVAGIGVMSLGSRWLSRLDTFNRPAPSVLRC